MEHAGLLDQLHATLKNLESCRRPEWNILDLFLRSWLTHHIMKFDGEFAEFLKSDPLAPDEEASRVS